MEKYENLVEVIAENLIYYRKLNKLTQLQLAEKLNYSDKAISKWERGESLPDLYILNNIAQIYGVTLNDLTSETKTQPVKKRGTIRLLVTLLSVFLVWLVATVAFVIIKIIDPELPRVWLSFIFAIPVSMIVLVVFASIWGGYLYKFFTISGLCWSVPLALTVAIPIKYMWTLFLCVIPLQILVIFFLILRKKIKN